MVQGFFTPLCRLNTMPQVTKDCDNKKGSAFTLPNKNQSENLSVLRHGVVHTVGPRQNPSSQIVDFFKSCLPQEIYRLGAAHTRTAMRYDLAAGVEFVYALGQVA